MAVDTRDNRASALQAFNWARTEGPLPDGTLSATDRRHVAHDYRFGISGFSSTPTITCEFKSQTIVCWPVGVTPSEVVTLEVDLAAKLAAAGRTISDVTASTRGVVTVAGPLLSGDSVIFQVSGGRRHRVAGVSLECELDDLQVWTVLIPIVVTV